jgi:hypothetical protein
MNKVVKYLYAELPIANKKQTYLDFEQSPKMLLFLNLLENVNILSTQKAISTIYKEEIKTTEYKVLINRFYKLRSKLHLHLLDQIKDNPYLLTKEEKELTFLRLLVIKNEYNDDVKRLKILEQKCWNDNLFELLPEIINLIKISMHEYQPNNNEILDYIEKAELAAELFFILQKFQNYIADFSVHNYHRTNAKTTIEDYHTVMNKMRRKSKKFKNFPRLNLIYHYAGFCIGCQIEMVTTTTSNVLSRHLNKLKELLGIYPDMPVDLYIPNHRLFNLHFVYLKEAIYWYYKQESKKSYACILQSKNIRINNPQTYFRTSKGVLNNVIICCLGAKEYEATLEYIEIMKELQLANGHNEGDIPYFIYEAINYTEIYPKIKHANPEKIISLCEQFLPTIGAESMWMYESVGAFCLVYGFLDKSEFFLDRGVDLRFSMVKDIPISVLDLLKLVMQKDRKGIQDYINLIQKLKKETKSRTVIGYLDTLKRLAYHF